MNTDLQLAGNIIYTGTTKFSCKSFDSLSIVNITFNNGKCYARCTQGTCAANFKNKHNIHCQDEEFESTHICCHLQTLFTNLENLKSFCPNFFLSSYEEFFIHDSTPNNNEELNTENQILSQTKIHEGFNQEKGIWKYESVTMHKPKEMMDEHLVYCTEERNDYIHSTKIDRTTGLYQTFHLKASTMTKENTEILCQCGTSYHKEGIYKDRGTLYMQTGPVNIKYYDAVCSKGICMIPYTKGVDEKAIFMYSTVTTAGDKIGWDFVMAVTTTKSSFSAFCKEMTRKYQTTNIMAGPFMSPTTFIKWFFGWIASFKIDFHKEIDPWCLYNLRMLACDGTHIGVSVMNLCLDPVVTTNDDKHTTLKSVHKRNYRLILQDKTHQKHMHYLARKFLKKLKPREILHAEVEEKKTTQLLNYAHEKCFNAFYEILFVFSYNLQHKNTLHIIAQLLLMFLGILLHLQLHLSNHMTCYYQCVIMLVEGLYFRIKLKK